MPDPVKTDAIPAASSSANNGATVTPESLRAAQDAAESARKEVAELKEAIEERDSQLSEFQTKLKTFEDNFERRGKGEKVTDPAALAKLLRQQAANGDKDAIAVTEAAREIAREEFGNASMKERIEASYGDQELFLAEKAKKHGMSMEKLIETIDPHAGAFMKELPHLQTELAYESWLNVVALQDREAKIIAREKELGLWKDSGTETTPSPEKKPDEPKNWRDAKTPAEKRAMLNDL